MVLSDRELHHTGVVTSAVGFGCAGLFRIPDRKARLTVLHAAYDVGIRHFDTAPMYGLGLSERELGTFLKHRREEVTVTTKCGIDPTFLTRTLAPLQKPARVFLARKPAIAEGLKTAGKSPHSGAVGRLLYSTPGYDLHSAQKSLERSLRALDTDYIDVFLLHDPIGELMTNSSELADYLDAQCTVGRIRCWGVTGQPSQLGGLMESLRWPTVMQYRDDVFDEDMRKPTADARITYGALARAVPTLRWFLARSPGDSARWSERLGVDLRVEATLPRLLLATALQRNASGPVLFTTSRPERLVLAASTPADSTCSVTQTTAFSELIATVRAAHPELMGQA